MFQTFLRSSLLIATGLLVVGCADNKNEAPVVGRLTVDGKPVPEISIFLVPDDIKTPGYVAQSMDDGGFEMRSFKGKKGVAPGVYSVQLSIPVGSAGGGMVKPGFVGTASPWRVTVTDKGIADLQLDMDKEKLE
jgi:hypothetical protein